MRDTCAPPSALNTTHISRGVKKLQQVRALVASSSKEIRHSLDGFQFLVISSIVNAVTPRAHLDERLALIGREFGKRLE
jgi:hypothetical protein